jgi:FtsZ-binding cell division protein ZapB
LENSAKIIAMWQELSTKLEHKVDELSKKVEELTREIEELRAENHALKKEKKNNGI